VTVKADSIKAVLPVSVELQGDGIKSCSGSNPLRVDVGQLAGRLSNRIDWDCDGTTERALATWLVIAKPDSIITATAFHQRAGKDRKNIRLTLDA
jgi:hypothetical protein